MSFKNSVYDAERAAIPAPDRLIPLARVAELIGVEEPTLRTWRHRGEGPKSFKVGSKVVYRESVLKAWIAEQEEATSSH